MFDRLFLVHLKKKKKKRRKGKRWGTFLFTNHLAISNTTVLLIFSSTESWILDLSQACRTIKRFMCLQDVCTPALLLHRRCTGGWAGSRTVCFPQVSSFLNFSLFGQRIKTQSSHKCPLLVIFTWFLHHFPLDYPVWCAPWVFNAGILSKLESSEFSKLYRIDYIP